MTVYCTVFTYLDKNTWFTVQCGGFSPVYSAVGTATKRSITQRLCHLT